MSTIRVAIRGLLRAPAYTMTAIGTVTLTIALAGTVFAVVDGVLFKPLPIPEADRVFSLSGWDGEPQTGGASMAWGDVEYLAEADPRIGITAVGFGRSFTDPNRPETPYWAQGVDRAFFEVFQQTPLVGGFTPQDFADAALPDGPAPVLVSRRFWVQLLGADPDAVGRVVQLGRSRFIVRGVLPGDFLYPEGPADMLMPLVVPADAAADRWERRLSVFARLRGAISRAEARSRMAAALEAHVDEYQPRANVIPGPYVAVRMRPVADYLKRNDQFTAAFAVAALLVVLGAVNVAGLFAARARDRQRELAIRLALGGSRLALMKTLLAEASLIAAAGCAAGVVVCGALLDAALSLLPPQTQFLKDPQVDVRVLLFAAAAAIIPVVLCTFVPSLAAVRRAPADRLAGVHAATPRVRGWARSGVLAIETALGTVLIALGALLLTSYGLIRSEDAGFDRERLVIVELTSQQTRSTQEFDDLQARAFQRMRTLPGVSGAAAIDGWLLRRAYAGSTFSPPEGAREVFTNDFPVSETFFEVAGLELLHGRYPTRAELAARAPVAVISADVADAYWPGRSALGQLLTSSDGTAGAVTVTVIGVVEPARLAQQDAGHDGEIYIAQGLLVRRLPRAFLLRTNSPQAVAQDLALVLPRDVSGVLVRRAASFDDALAESVRDHHARMVMFSVTGAAALLLVSVGVVGLVASGVARRVREIGIRSALGAHQSHIIRMIVVEYLKPVAFGLVAGTLASWWTVTLVERFVYEIRPFEPTVIAASVATLLIATAIAAWIPARRASAADPVAVLRME